MYCTWICQLDLPVYLVQILLHKDADHNIQANDGWTALLFACQNVHWQVIEVLLKKDTDPDIQSVEGSILTFVIN